MENRNDVRVTTDNWLEVVDRIDWRQPEIVDSQGNRSVVSVNGNTRYIIPFDVWYDNKAYAKPWRRLIEIKQAGTLA